MNADQSKVVECVSSSRIIAIIRGFEPDVCLHLAECYVKGGIRMIEVTFPQSAPEQWCRTAEAISLIRNRFGEQLLVGAGTVINGEQLQIARDAGAMYAISPNVNPELIRETVEKGLVAMPGALTPSEMVSAHEAGAQFVKIFPAGALGASYVKAVRAPLSHIPMLAVGGISAANVEEFIAAGCVGAGVGGNLTKREFIEEKAWDKITAVAVELTEKVKKGMQK